MPKVILEVTQIRTVNVEVEVDDHFVIRQLNRTHFRRQGRILSADNKTYDAIPFFDRAKAIQEELDKELFELYKKSSVDISIGTFSTPKITDYSFVDTDLEEKVWDK